ncbi:MAG: helix-turn-helix transcriptional regulator [Acidobacteria bacterium]|nr:helix-turn-helix transcriptional regulator [Acidobacteriota bacterium]
MPRLSKLTFATGLILEAVERGYRYGFDIMDASGLPDGTVYPALRRLEAAGCLSSAWEDEEQARREKRPARRYYEITAAGEAVLAQARARFRGLPHALAPSAQPEPAR